MKSPVKQSEDARRVMERLEILGRISDEPGRLTRGFGGPAMRRVSRVVGKWMRAAGMTVRQDAIGNLIGHSPAQTKSRLRRGGTGRKVLLIGSHLDTVRDAGKYDGTLGVLTAITCVQQIRREEQTLPFDIEVIGFADEEGWRYRQAYLGSSVVAGRFNFKSLQRRDANGIRLAEAITELGGNAQALSSARMDGRRLIGYVEVHIEQGPVLDEKQLAVAAVSGIAGQTRAAVTFHGRAGHAGTTPMQSRRDALCAAADFVLWVEAFARRRRGLRATVGEIQALPGASNVIPGEVRLSLDVRSGNDRDRSKAMTAVKKAGRQRAAARGVKLGWEEISATQAVRCDPQLTDVLQRSLKRRQKQRLLLESFAGHDAAMMAAITPVTMLFVRCKKGISHHPDESISTADVRVALAVLGDFVKELARGYG